MKKIGILTICLALIGSLAACGGAAGPDSAPEVEEIEEIEEMEEMEKTEQTEKLTEAPTPNTPEPSTPAPEQTERAEKEPQTEQTTALTLEQRLTGCYQRPVGTPDTPEREVAELRILGGRLCIEMGNVAGAGECYTFWNYDGVPEDPAIWERTDTDAVRCQVRFSSLQTAIPQEPELLTLELDGDTLTLNGTAYTRTADPSPFHSTPEELRTMTGLPLPSEGDGLPLGEWYGETDGEIQYLALKEGGTMEWDRVTPGESAVLTQGIFSWESNNARIDYILERSGHGRMPLTGSFMMEKLPNDSLKLTGEELNITLRPAPEGWTLYPNPEN